MEAKKRIAKNGLQRRMAYNEGYQTGVKEVVEWIMSNADLERGDRDAGLCFEDYLHFEYQKWQTFLKEKGIKDIWGI